MQAQPQEDDRQRSDHGEVAGRAPVHARGDQRREIDVLDHDHSVGRQAFALGRDVELAFRFGCSFSGEETAA